MWLKKPTSQPIQQGAARLPSGRRLLTQLHADEPASNSREVGTGSTLGRVLAWHSGVTATHMEGEWVVKTVRNRRVFNAQLCALLGTATTAYSTSQARTSAPEPPHPGIDLQFDDSQLGTIEVPLTEAVDLSRAADAAHSGAQSAASMPGYNPAAGLAGTAIGLGIARQFENSSLRKKANAPVEPLRTMYASHWRELGLHDSLWREWDAHGSPDQQRCSPEVGRRCARHLTLRPTMKLLSSARILCVSIEAKLQDGKSARTDRLVFMSRPVSVTRIDEINDHWSRENLRAIAEEWSQAVTTLVPLLQAQIEIRDKPTQPATAIRFVNAAGLFYDRGVIQAQDGQRIAYRSLDGSITSAYMDRLLTTQEYYDWLAGEPAPSAPQ